jgi:aminomethyltransferase
MKGTEVGYNAIRNSVAFTEEPDLCCLQLTGRQAFDVFDAVCPCDIFLQDGQMKYTLLLNEDGTPFADIYVCRKGEDAYLLGYGPNVDTLIDWITEHSAENADFSIIDLSKTYAPLALDGPYAWELCAEVLGPDILGLPYLGMKVSDEVLVFRAGQTGEYGYHLLVPTDQKNAWLEKLHTAGSVFEMAHANEAARAQCALENFFFDINREGQYGLTPFELQLQWRLSAQKAVYPGAEAIRTRRQSGWTRRLTCFSTPDPVKVDTAVVCDDEVVGHILAVGYSPVRGDYVGKALLRRPYWHAGLDVFQVQGCPLKTLSPPAVDNLSWNISPYNDSFHTREKENGS